MQGVETEITNYLDEKISDLAKNRLPEAPEYPFGNSQYASFMTPRDGTTEGDVDRWEASRYTTKPASSSAERNALSKYGDRSRDGYVSLVT